MDNVHFYSTTVEWDKDRIGDLSAPGMQTFKAATPPEFPKGVPGIWSPEHLFVASVNVCLMTTFLAIAENSSLSFAGFSCTASGKLEKIDGKFMMSEIELKPVVKLNDEKDKEKALRIIDKAEKACLISNSIKSKIILLPEAIL